jgi:hypothetical protein
MNVLNKLGGRLPDFGEVVRRFPVAVLMMVGLTLWLIQNNLTTSYGDGEVVGGLVLAGYLAVNLQLMAESRGWTKGVSLLIKLFAAALAVGLCIFFERLDFAFWFAILAAILFLGNARLWRRDRDDPVVWNFTQKLWTGAIFATVGSIIFTLGVFAIQTAIEVLFGARIDRLTEDIVLPIGLAFLAPVYWLGTLPKPDATGEVEELSFEARALSFLGTWMLAPLLSVYALIILAYAAKVIFQWDLPKGEIAWLVTPFIGVGTLVWLMLEPKVLNEGTFVRFYRRAWHWVMLPATLLLGIAVFVRVQAYGLTVERVFLLAVFVWALLQTIWFAILPTKKRDIRIPTAMAAVGLMFCAFLAQPLSVWSQLSRAEAAKADLGEFSAEATKANPEAAKAFIGSMEYLVKNDYHKQAKSVTPDVPDTRYGRYGDEWRSYLRRLHLVDVADTNMQSQYVELLPTDIRISQPATLYGPERLWLSETSFSGRSDDVPGFVKIDGFDVTWSDGDVSFVFDLQPVLQSVVRPAETEVRESRTLPVMTSSDEAGRTATLYVRDGQLEWSGDGRVSTRMNLIIAVTD